MLQRVIFNGHEKFKSEGRKIGKFKKSKIFVKKNKNI